ARRLLGGYFPDESAAGNLHHQVLSGRAVHPFTQTSFAVGRDEAWLKILGDEIIQVVVSFQDNVAAAAAVAATGPALGAIFLPLKGHATLAAVAGSGVNFYFVYEHVLKPE